MLSSSHLKSNVMDSFCSSIGHSTVYEIRNSVVPFISIVHVAIHKEEVTSLDRAKAFNFFRCNKKIKCKLI